MKFAQSWESKGISLPGRYPKDIASVPASSCAAAMVKNIPDGAYCLSKKSDGEKQISLLKRASDQRHLIAQNELASIQADQKVISRSSEINSLIRSAADGGTPHAQVTVGWWHMTGEWWLKVDHKKAMEWNLKAYKQGHSEGANHIGKLYERGLGVRKDLDAAKAWYKKASVLGNREVTERLARLSK